MSNLTLWSFNIETAFGGDRFQETLSWLPLVEHASVMRFKFDRDRHLALASLLLRRHYFSQELQVPWSTLEFGRLPGGKPYLRNNEDNNYDFNISHEGNWVIFGCLKGFQVGVDVVKIDRPAYASVDAFIKGFEAQLTNRELKLIMNQQESSMRLQTFSELWGCKESYTKATGVGLSLDLSKLDFINEENQIKMNFEDKPIASWHFYLTYLDHETIAVVCYSCELIQFPTKLIGTESCLTKQSNVFCPIKLQDIAENPWKN